MSIRRTHDHQARSGLVRELLDHPVVDSDAHWLEPVPILLDYLREEAGEATVGRYLDFFEQRSASWYATPDTRHATRRHRPGWWTWPADTFDRATAMLPALLRERLDDFGIDVSIVYPTLGVTLAGLADETLRLPAVRAFNRMTRDMFADHSDRLVPVGIIPMYTPHEALEGLEFAVKTCGFKACLLSGVVRRPVPAHADQPAPPSYLDHLVLDSAFDYDPVWRRCLELGVAVTVHTPGQGWLDRASTTNYVFNHIGHFAATNHAFAKALVLSGVPRRFPGLRFAFLEGGVGWARILIEDLAGHWQKRARTPLVRNLCPSNLDTTELAALFQTYGGNRFANRFGEMLDNLDPARPGWSIDRLTSCEDANRLDDFEAAGVGSREELQQLFATNFYFGCEADDPMTAVAYDRAFGPRLKPLFSSDIGHFDLTDMATVVAEAFELVEEGLLTLRDFRSFSFTHAIELHGGMNPRFFDGTVVEAAARNEMATFVAPFEQS